MLWNLLFILLWSGGLNAAHCSFSDLAKDQNITLAFAAPDTFGKTHFIVGHPDQERVSSRYAMPAPPQKTPFVRSFFSPDDDVKKELVRLIDQEQAAIKVAVFIVTDPEIAQALIRAKKRGVSVTLVTDVGCLKEKANKVSTLCDRGCKLYVYDASARNKAYSLMHHKFALFESSEIVWTGSYNFTKAAGISNQENAVIIADSKTYNQFNYQFKRLKNRSYRYGKQARA